MEIHTHTKKSLILHLKHLSQSFQLQTTSCTYINIHNCHVLNQWQLLPDKAKYIHSIVLSGLFKKITLSRKAVWLIWKFLWWRVRLFHIYQPFHMNRIFNLYLQNDRHMNTYPALLLTAVNSFTPVFSKPPMRFSGIPHNPKPTQNRTKLNM